MINELIGVLVFDRHALLTRPLRLCLSLPCIFCVHLRGLARSMHNQYDEHVSVEFKNSKKKRESQIIRLNKLHPF